MPLGAVKMGVLTRIYWIRFLLGIVAGLACTLYGIGESNIDITFFLTGATLAVLIYLLSYYVLKHVYLTKVERPTKIITTGIGIYFITWIVFWTLFWTIYWSLYCA